jgi:hypothetical protein
MQPLNTYVYNYISKKNIKFYILNTIFVITPNLSLYFQFLKIDNIKFTILKNFFNKIGLMLDLKLFQITYLQLSCLIFFFNHFLNGNELIKYLTKRNREINE